MTHFTTVFLLLSFRLSLVGSFVSTFRLPLNRVHRTLPALFSSNQNGGNMGFKRNSVNMGIPQKSASSQENNRAPTDQFRTEARRRKVGPPNRAGGGNGQMKSREENLVAGRVSVYCIGAGLDLGALRAHVFRRGFGNQGATGIPVEVRIQVM